MTDYLRRITDAANAARNNAAELEARLRKEMHAELLKDRTAVDIAAAEAYRAGISKSAIGRAMGTKDYSTYTGAIERGSRLIGADAALSSGIVIKGYAGDEITIQRGNEEAEFLIAAIEDEFMNVHIEFYSQTPLYDDKYDKKNSLVAELDSADSGSLYEEVLAWIKAH